MYQVARDLNLTEILTKIHWEISTHFSLIFCWHLLCFCYYKTFKKYQQQKLRKLCAAAAIEIVSGQTLREL